MTGDQTFYVGTYTRGRREGIYACRLNSGGVITVEGDLPAGSNPSFLATDSRRQFLYAVNEMADSPEEANGAISAFAIDRESRGLRLLNRQPSMGTAPCHVAVDRRDRFVLAANYGSGSAVVLPIRGDGSIGPATDVVQHTGSGAHPKRQAAPHAHCVALSGDNRFAYVVDLGIDKVMIYHFNDEAGTLLPADPPSVQLPPGTGPRHLAFDRTGSWAYLVNELTPTLNVFSVNGSNGTLHDVQTVLTLPENFTGESYGAEIVVEPSGRFVYASLRGHNSLAVYSVDTKTGQLSLLQHQSTGGNWPRSFAVDPVGKYLLVANERSDSVTVFAIDPDNGRLTPTGHQALVPSPVCVLFV